MFNFCEEKLSSTRLCSYREGSLDFVQPNLNLLASVQDQVPFTNTEVILKIKLRVRAGQILSRRR